MWRGSSHAGQLKELCHSESRHVCLRLTKQNKHDLFKSSCASSRKTRRRSGWCALVRAKSSKPATKRSSRRNLRVLTDSLEQKIALERRDRSMFLPSSCCRRSSSPPEYSKMVYKRLSCREIKGRIERTETCLSSHRDCHTAAENLLPSVLNESTGGAPFHCSGDDLMSENRGQTARISRRSAPYHASLLRELSQL